MAGLGLYAQLAGVGLNAVGTYQGTKALERAKSRELDESQGFDREREALLGRYLAGFDRAPVGGVENATATDESLLASNAMQGSGAGAAALGIRGGPPITPDRRLATRTRGMQRRLLGARLGEQRLDADLGDVERHREDLAATYPFRERDAAKTGSEWRQLGSLLGAGGSALSAYEMTRGDNRRQPGRLMSSTPSYQASPNQANVETGGRMTNDVQDLSWLWGTR